LVAAQGVRTLAWGVAAAIATGFLAALALHGERPEPGLDRFEPAGLLVDWPVDEITVLDVALEQRQHSFHRLDDGWHIDHSDAPTALGDRVNTGLKLLHNSAPQRVFAPAEFSERSLAEFGLDPPRLTVSARRVDGRTITIRFGGANLMGLARYTRVEGRAEVILLPAFVAEAWEHVMEAP
jgi:hypothetical protein